ncbi:MAG TPA: response regulator transcription factor [Actinobacteria bacterium]|nr:response regulator transcription factor [Actinomycetota bacterium]
MIDVLLVDDQEMVRTGFGMILQTESDISVVGEAGDGADAVRDTRRLRPDVVLMDIRMPTMDGIEATRLIMNDTNNSSRVLMLTTFDLDEYVYDAIRAGAAGFLLKDAPPEELVNAIRIIAEGQALLAPSVTRRLIEEFASRPSSTAPSLDQLDQLTEREVEVLQVMARGMTNAEIAEALFVSETTVKTHVSHILTKLALRDRVQAVVFAYECGLVERGSGSK